MDKLNPEQRRKNMRAVKNHGSKIELELGKALRACGIRYRLCSSSIYGRPDFSIKKYKIAIFADSEFWHGKSWPECKKDFKTNSFFWISKIEKNIERDKAVNSYLHNEGWTVFRFWGKDIMADPDICAELVYKAIKEIKASVGGV